MSFITTTAKKNTTIHHKFVAMASSTFLNMKKKLADIEVEVAKLRDQQKSSAETELSVQLTENINQINEALVASSSEAAQMKSESAERYEALDRKMDGIVAELAALRVAVSEKSQQQPLTLSIPAEPIPTQKELSPRIRRKLAELSFEAVGGQTVRCVRCGKQQAYHSKRIAEHVCKE